jgi:tetratricopeptide (TPR) repeat protein
MTDEKNGTRIDLGSDLIESSESHSTIPQEYSDFTGFHDLSEVGGVADLFQSAKILTNEGFAEDAKKILRQILIVDPSHAAARKLLNDIHELELKQIFISDESTRPYRLRQPEIRESEVDADAVMHLLDRDLKLGIFGEESSQVRVHQLSLFADGQALEEFLVKVEGDLAGSPARDWVDLGIAFLEMDFYEIAIRLFSGAARKASSDIASEIKISANCLLALALILADRPYEAISELQPLIRDTEILYEEKIEIFYLMARTYEAMKKWDLAFGFYMQVKDIDPHYRDIDYRLRTKK